MLDALGVVVVLLAALQWATLVLSQSSVTISAAPAATSAATNCGDTVAGTNVSVCFFTVADIPSCARVCVEEAALTMPCATTDLKCLCAHSNDLETAVMPCLKGNCSLTDLTTTVNYYFGICNNNHFPLQGAAVSATASNLPATSAATTSAATPARASPGLSTGAKAGIGIACAIAGLLALLALGFFLLKSRKRSKATQQKPPPATSPRQSSRHSGAPLRPPPPAFAPGSQGMTELGEKSLPPTPRRLSLVKSKRPFALEERRGVDTTAVDGVKGRSAWAVPRGPVEIEAAMPAEIDGVETERGPPRY